MVSISMISTGSESYHTAVASSGVFLHNIVEAFFHLLRLLGVHEFADRFGWILEGRVILIYADLGDHGCHRYVRDIAVQKLLA